MSYEKQAFERVRNFLEKFDMELVPVEQQQTTKTSVEAAEALGVELGQIAKSILFRCKDRYGLFVAAGDIKISDKKVKGLLGGGKAKIASPEEVEKITGYRVGGVCPFDIDAEVPIFIDRSMQRFDVVYAAAGTSFSMLPISVNQLKKVTGGTVADIARD